MNTRYLEKITDTSLDDGTYRMIDAMLSQDFVLGNYNDAEMHEFRWELPLLGLKVEVAHPPKESFVQGDDRQYYADDESDGLKSLSDIQKNDIYQILRLGVKARGTRSHGGFQQEELGKTVSVSEVRDDNQGQQNGFFSGWG